MPSKKRESAAIIKVADGLGGLRTVADHRFESDDWPILVSVVAAEANDWMAHLTAEVAERGWSAASVGQLDADANSGSQTIQMAAGATGPSIDLTWEKQRAGPLQIRARPSGEPVADRALFHGFFDAIAARVSAGRKDRGHRRFWLSYDGLPWEGELWLTDAVCLSPASKRPPALIGRQVLIVDATVDGIGTAGVTANFQSLLRELRLVLSPILGLHLESTPQWRSEWVPEIDEAGKITDCRLRPIGYTEMTGIPGMPQRGALPATALETVVRPGLGRYGIWGGNHAARVPHDVIDLWQAFGALTAALKQQFLHACNAYSIARSMFPDQRTAYAVFLVVTCEALKPAGKKYDGLNIYDVVASLIDAQTAESLKSLRISPQNVRSKHVHGAALVADELAPWLMADPFADPSFDETLMALSRVARQCLIEWLRKGGKYALKEMPRPSAARSGRRR